MLQFLICIKCCNILHTLYEDDKGFQRSVWLGNGSGQINSLPSYLYFEGPGFCSAVYCCEMRLC